MRIILVISFLAITSLSLSFGFRKEKAYQSIYNRSLHSFREEQQSLLKLVQASNLADPSAIERIRERLHGNRMKLKSVDFWLRYFEPIVYRRINGPLPVEWENEVFEKFEPPYRREGAGLSLAELYLDEASPSRDSLFSLVNKSLEAISTFEADSITVELRTPDHFFLANRLFLLNLAAIYTTGFECPDTSRVIPELRSMMEAVGEIYSAFNNEFRETGLSAEYLARYAAATRFVNEQPGNISSFDHYEFIREFINPLFAQNQQFIRENGVRTRNFNDYSLDNNATSIFSKSLFHPQNTRGIYSLITDEELLGEIKSVGKLLFYDPILSANNSRSCASCHKPAEFFTDTSVATAFRFDHQGRLERNTPSLINSIFNHLLMLDGRHISLQDQGKDVMHNPEEMNLGAEELVKKVMSCREYRDAFKKFLRHTPEEKEVSIDHITSALSYYFADFSFYDAPFDEAMNYRSAIGEDARRGFNLYMSKSQCATCHFVPTFSGVRPPYIGTEFEVLGVPADTTYTTLSNDKGRYLVNPATETANAFRTTTLRNAAHTKPYMHNGVFHSLEQVIDFYDGGGGAGRKLNVPNQTLSSDSLRLSGDEKRQLIAFIHTLSENINFDTPPGKLPPSGDRKLNNRKVGGEY